MHLRSEVIDTGGGTFRKRRWVEEVLVVEPSPDATRGYSTDAVFAPSTTGQASDTGQASATGRVVATGRLADRLPLELARHGFDLEAYKTEAAAHDGPYEAGHRGELTT